MSSVTPCGSRAPRVGAPCAPRSRPKASLETLPAELHALILDTLDEDSLARLGSTDRLWRSRTQPYLYPAHLSATQAVLQGRRHLLGRMWNTPCDVSPYTTHVRDADGMTHLMHAATTGDFALLKCLMRHGNGQLQQSDSAGLNAVDWAYLTGHFGAFSGAALMVHRAQRVGPERQQRITLHDAIAAGHWHLVATLLGPHHTRLIQGHPSVQRQGYELTARLSCGLSAAFCAAQHAPKERLLIEALSQHPHIRKVQPLHQAALAASASIGEAKQLNTRT